jgi:hypothetical protein
MFKKINCKKKSCMCAEFDNINIAEEGHITKP